MFHPWQSKGNETGVLGLLYEYLPSIVITVGNFVVPVLCDQIALLERYNPSITVILALLRFVHVLNLPCCVCVYVFMYVCVMYVNYVFMYEGTYERATEGGTVVVQWLLNNFNYVDVKKQIWVQNQ